MVPLSLFSQRNFRLTWSSVMLGGMGVQMETIVLAWYILILTDSPFLVGLVTASRLAANLLALYAGAVVDRLPRHMILAVVGLAWTSLSLLMLFLLVTDLLAVWHVFVIAFTGGLVRTFQMPAGQSLAADSVTPDRISNAVALINTGMDVNLIFGATMVGFLYKAYGPEGAYALIAVIYATSGIAALFIQVQRSGIVRNQESVWRMISTGLLYVKGSQVLWAALALAVIINLTGFPLHTTLMPVFAKDVLDVDVQGLGLLISAFGIGAFIGSLNLAFTGSVKHTGIRLIVAVIIWHASMAVFSRSTSFPLSLAILVVTGMAFSSTLVLILTVLLRTVTPEFRGRITGLRVLAIYAHTFGSTTAGFLASMWGAPTTAAINGIVGIALVVALASLTPKFRRV
ncbi:MAG: hypothetical protein BZY79_01615 [SAR202 cluster bacterium Casp-Chloro-G4]|nr:MAG: hypothetical protein BZY79_01615 [SAR202 cluster bacterium Casp-Chloro-G4]